MAHPARKEAERAAAEITKRQHDGEYRSPDRITLAEYLTDRWLPLKKSQLSRSTFDSYRDNVRLHVARASGRSSSDSSSPRTSTRSTPSCSPTRTARAPSTATSPTSPAHRPCGMPERTSNRCGRPTSCGRSSTRSRTPTGSHRSTSPRTGMRRGELLGMT
jgi:hypothetical protein